MKKVIAVIACEETSAAQKSTAFNLLTTFENVNINICGNLGLEELVFSTNNYITGFIPWLTFNPTVQAKCNRIFSYQTYKAEMRYAANDMVEDIHDKYRDLSQGAKKMLARIYLCIAECDEVFVFPCYTKGGGSGMAIEIAKRLGKKLIVVNRDGEVI